MKSMRTKTQFRKNKATKESNLPVKKKMQSENLDIIKGVQLQIITTKVEKAKKDIHGNYIYKIENDTHFEIDTELDFSKSENITTNEYSYELIFKEKIDPFTKSIPNDLKKTDSEFIIPGKVCEIQYLIGYLVNSKMKFDIKFPSFEKQKNMIKADDETILASYNICNSSLKPFALEKMSSLEITDILIQLGIVNFVDPDYYPWLKEVEVDAKEDGSIKTIIAIHWRRLPNIFTTIVDNSLYNIEEITPFDIGWGVKPIKPTMCLFSFFAEFPSLIDRVFIDKIYNSYGVYTLRLFINGTWEKIFIDDYIPCFPKTVPIYTYDIQMKSVWIVLLEKVLAKFFGSHEILHKVKPERLLKLLTGFPVYSYKVGDFKSEELFHKMEEAYSNGYIVFAYNNVSMDKKNLYEQYFDKDFFYPIVNTVKIDSQKVIVLRNIWKKKEYDFNYYTSKQNLSKNERKQIEKLDELSVAIFNDIEFFNLFNNVIICAFKNFYETNYRGKFVRVQDLVDTDIEAILSYYYYEINITEKTDMKILLSFDEENFFDDKYIVSHPDISIGVLQLVNETWSIYYSQDFVFDKQIFLEITLNPGVYYIVPRTSGFGMRKKPSLNKMDVDDLFVEGELNMVLLKNVIRDIFINNDPDCVGYLEYNNMYNIMHRLNIDLDPIEFEKYVKKYSNGCQGLNYKGLENLIRDIFVIKSESNIREFLRNLGYDKHLFPYLYRFYYLHFYSSNPFSCQYKYNLNLNLENILNCLLLEEESKKINEKNEVSLVSIKNMNDKIFIQGVKNNSKKEIKEIQLDLSSSKNLYISTNYPKISKIVNPGKVEFFMYLVSESLLPENSNVEHKKIINVQLKNIKILNK